MGKTRNTTDREWASRIIALRRRMGVSQSELGKQLNSSAMAVSRWERGVQDPPADIYIQLGNITGDPECWYFWGRAGLHSGDLMRVLPAVRSRLQKERLPALQIVQAGAHRLRKKGSHLVAIPVLPVVAATHGGKGDPEVALDQMKPETVLAAPSSWCPNPAYTTCLRVKGHSMGPLIHDGYIVAVDYSQTDRSELDGKLVVVWNEEKGLSISRFRRYRGVEVLEPENREYESMALSTDRAWRVIGRVLWWIGKAP